MASQKWQVNPTLEKSKQHSAALQAFAIGTTSIYTSEKPIPGHTSIDHLIKGQGMLRSAIRVRPLVMLLGLVLPSLIWAEPSCLRVDMVFSQLASLR